MNNNTNFCKLFLLTLCFAYSGCVTVGSLKNTSINEADSRVVRAGLKKSFNLTEKAALKCELDVEDVERSESAWKIVASHRASIFSWGELILIAGVSKNVKETDIRIIAKAKVATNIMADADKLKYCIWNTIEEELKN